MAGRDHHGRRRPLAHQNSQNRRGEDCRDLRRMQVCSLAPRVGVGRHLEHNHVAGIQRGHRRAVPAGREAPARRGGAGSMHRLSPNTTTQKGVRLSGPNGSAGTEAKQPKLPSAGRASRTAMLRAEGAPAWHDAARPATPPSLRSQPSHALLPPHCLLQPGLLLPFPPHPPPLPRPAPQRTPQSLNGELRGGPCPQPPPNSVPPAPPSNSSPNPLPHVPELDGAVGAAREEQRPRSVQARHHRVVRPPHAVLRAAAMAHVQVAVVHTPALREAAELVAWTSGIIRCCRRLVQRASNTQARRWATTLDRAGAPRPTVRAAHAALTGPAAPNCATLPPVRRSQRIMLASLEPAARGDFRVLGFLGLRAF